MGRKDLMVIFSVSGNGLDPSSSCVCRPPILQRRPSRDGQEGQERDRTLLQEYLRIKGVI